MQFQVRSCLGTEYCQSNSPLTLPSTHSVVNGLASGSDTVTMYYVVVWVFKMSPEFHLILVLWYISSDHVRSTREGKATAPSPQVRLKADLVEVYKYFCGSCRNFCSSRRVFCADKVERIISCTVVMHLLL